MHSNQRRPWRKILYQVQPYPDNYVDSSFLSCLITNASTDSRRMTYWQMVASTAPLVLRIASLAIFLSMFYFLENGVGANDSAMSATLESILLTANRSQLLIADESSAPHTLRLRAVSLLWSLPTPSAVLPALLGSAPAVLASDASKQVAVRIVAFVTAADLIVVNLALTLLGSLCLIYLTYRRLQRENRAAYSMHGEPAAGDATASPSKSVREGIKSASQRLVVFSGLLLCLSPVLRTLTLSYSSDTIWALTLAACVLHVLSFDYSFVSSDGAQAGTVARASGSHSSASTPIPSCNRSAPGMRAERSECKLGTRRVLVRPSPPSASASPTELSGPRAAGSGSKLLGEPSAEALSATTTASVRSGSEFRREEAAPRVRSRSKKVHNPRSSGAEGLELKEEQPKTAALAAARLGGPTTGTASLATPQAVATSAVDGSLQSALSLNAAIFASVLLASRLPASADFAYALVYWAFLLFAGAPLLDAALRSHSFALHLGHLGSPVLCSFGFIWPVFSFSFSALSLLLLAHHSLPAATALVALVLLIMFVCPLAFGHAQQYKQEYEGPWDYDDAGEKGADNI